MSLASRFFRWHRWLAWLILIQVAAWVLGGLVFAWLPFQGWVKSADWVDKPKIEMTAGWAAALAAAGADAQPLSGLSAVATARGPALRLTPAKGAPRWLAPDGQALPAPDAAAVAGFARSLYRGPGALAGVEHLAQVPVRLGIVKEARAGAQGVWLARFDDRLATRIYVDGRGGELVAVRSDAWVLYDFFWRLHVMDYEHGEDFNNSLLRGGSLLAAGLVLTGSVLAWLAARRRWRRRT